MKVVLAGGSGALGRRLAADFAACENDVVVLTRRFRRGGAHRQVVWDGLTVGDWGAELADSVLINLVGELVDRRPTSRNIALLTNSRVAPTLALAAAARHAKPSVWVQLSTLAIYGDAGDAVLDETAVPGEGPPQMAGVARAWEATAAGAPAGRQVVLRTGVVLDSGTPALNRLVGLARWGLGGRIGDGRQWISWLHIDDFISIVRRAVSDESLTGVVHATSPNPAQKRDFMVALRHALRRPSAPPTPVAVARLGAFLLRTDPALALTGRRCVPRRLTERGFEFEHPDLAEALRRLLTQTATT